MWCEINDGNEGNNYETDKVNSKKTPIAERIRTSFAESYTPTITAIIIIIIIIIIWNKIFYENWILWADQNLM